MRVQSPRSGVIVAEQIKTRAGVSTASHFGSEMAGLGRTGIRSAPVWGMLSEFNEQQIVPGRRRARGSCSPPFESSMIRLAIIKLAASSRLKPAARNAPSKAIATGPSKALATTLLSFGTDDRSLSAGGCARHFRTAIALGSKNRLRWPRLFEQKIRVAKWIVGRG